MKAIWNSRKGYSKSNEIVELTGLKHDDLKQIKSFADPFEDTEFFYYWVPEEELNTIQ